MATTGDTEARIGDVARAAGVSTTTVSRVLNGRAAAIRISAATVERVRHAAEHLHYHPNASALSLRTAKTRTIGVVARDLLTPWAAQLLRTVYAVCESRGYYLLLSHAEHSRGKGRELSSILRSDRVDGVLFIGDMLGLAEAQGWGELDGRVQLHRHVVSVGTRPSVAGGLSVTIDFAYGTCLALEHLMTLGHRVIGYIGPRTGHEAWESQQRFCAYRQFLDAHGLPRDPANEVIFLPSVNAAQVVLRDMLMRPQGPSAVFVENDSLAILVLRAALTCGVRVPADLSIVGFDDIPFAALSAPSLTTVHYPIEEIARCAATGLLDRIEGKSPSGEMAETDPTVLFVPTLISRESTGPVLTAQRGSVVRLANSY